MRTAVITGAGDGIGRATARRLSRDGMRVVAVGRTGATLRALVDELRREGGVADAVEADVTDPAALRRALDWPGACSGGERKEPRPGPERQAPGVVSWGSPPDPLVLDRVDVLVANAGVCARARLDDADADDVWANVLGVNLDGAWNTLRAVGPRLGAGGRVVLVSSGLGERGRAGYAAYCASKHGVLGLVRALAPELAPRGVTVNAVCPGWVDTRMAAADLERSARERGTTTEIERAAAVGAIPIGRFVAAEEVADLIAFLASPGAAAITGQAVSISGGEF